MFKANITQTPFTTDAADACFQNITGQLFGYDVSFLATLRALLAPRMGEEDRINLVFGSSNFEAGALHGVSDERAVSAICGSYYLSDRGQLIIHSLKGNQEGNEASFNAIEKKFTSVYDGYHRQEKLKVFYRKSFNLDCYINPELKSTIVFVENLDNKKMHYLQVTILAMMPWYLDQETGMTEEELALVYSMRETSPDKYNQCLAKMAEKYDFRSGRIRQLLNGFESRFEKMECDRVQREIDTYDAKIIELNNSIGDYLRHRNDSCIRLMGLKAKIAEGGESEIMEYFLCNRRLILERVTNTDMYFAVKDYLEYFDSDMAERIIRNHNSFAYAYGLARRGEAGVAKAEKLMTEIFVSENPRLRIRFCAAYRFALNGSVEALRNHDFGFEFDGYMPNTHINNYQCLGNYQRAINDMLRKRDYIAAVEQCVASCKSLNWGDSAVMEGFMNTFWNGFKCIELPDGSVVKAEQAIQWLEEQDKPAEEAKENGEKAEKEETVDEQAD